MQKHFFECFLFFIPTLNLVGRRARLQNEIDCFLFFSDVKFSWAQGANARGRTIGRGDSSLTLISPLSLRFSPHRNAGAALTSFLTFSPLYALHLLLCLVFIKFRGTRGSRNQEGGARGGNLKGIGGMRAQASFHLSSLGCRLAIAHRAQRNLTSGL